MQENELKVFIKQNSPWIYEYINKEILKDIGSISPSFFVRLIEEYFNKEDKRTSFDDVTVDNFIYFVLTEVLGESRHVFTFFRKDTMSLSELYKEVRVYFNYVRFTIEEDSFCIYLIQTKVGVSALEEELIKFTKQFPMKTTGIKEFIKSNCDVPLSEISKKIKEDINNLS